MLTTFDHSSRLASTTRLLLGVSAAALGLGLGVPAMAQTALPPVQVTGSQTGSYTAPSSDLVKLQEPLIDTPISVTTITQQLMEDRGDTNLNDALRNVPSVTLASNEFSFRATRPISADFPRAPTCSWTACATSACIIAIPSTWSEVEVLEGPDVILFGRGSTGGVIEQDTKTPQLEQFIDAQHQRRHQCSVAGDGRCERAHRRAGNARRLPPQR